MSLHHLKYKVLKNPKCAFDLLLLIHPFAQMFYYMVNSFAALVGYTGT